MDNGLLRGVHARAEFGDAAVARHSRYTISLTLGEPDIAVRPENDAVGTGFHGRHGELGDRPVQGDASDAVAFLLGEPEIAVAADRNTDWHAAGGGKGEFAERAGIGIEAADFRRAVLTEPQIAVTPFDGNVGLAVGRRNPVLADNGLRAWMDSG